MATWPYMKFFTGDWLKDPALTICSPATRGVWIDLLSAMHESDRSGKLCATRDQLARLARCSTVELTQALTEIQTNRVGEVTERNGAVVIINRRMHREHKSTNGNAERQARFREKGGGDPDRWTATRVRILERDNYICAYCGRKARTVDHIHPRCKGGDESETNLVACCYKCNCTKNGRDLAQTGLRIQFGMFALGESNGRSNGVEPDPEPDPEVQAKVISGRRPSLEEVKARCEMAGYPPTEGEAFWNHFEASGWIDKNGNPILKWEPKLASWVTNARARPAELKHHGSAGHSRPLSPLDIRTIIGAKEKKADALKAKHSSLTAQGDTWSNQKAFEEWRSIRKEIRQLNERLSNLA